LLKRGKAFGYMLTSVKKLVERWDVKAAQPWMDLFPSQVSLRSSSYSSSETNELHLLGLPKANKLADFFYKKDKEKEKKDKEKQEEEVDQKDETNKPKHIIVGKPIFWH